MSISLSQADVLTALRAALLSLLTGYEVVQAQDNGVPMPTGPFIAMTVHAIQRLSTNVDTYAGSPSIKSIETDTRFDVDLDIYGPLAGDAAATIQAVLRDEAGVALFPTTVVPLFADDPMQMPLITGEQTYLQRWKVTVALQYNPVVTLPQDSALALTIGLQDLP